MKILVEGGQGMIRYGGKSDVLIVLSFSISLYSRNWKFKIIASCDTIRLKTSKSTLHSSSEKIKFLYMHMSNDFIILIIRCNLMQQLYSYSVTFLRVMVEDGTRTTLIYVLKTIVFNQVESKNADIPVVANIRICSSHTVYVGSPCVCKSLKRKCSRKCSPQGKKKTKRFSQWPSSVAIIDLQLQEKATYT